MQRVDKVIYLFFFFVRKREVNQQASCTASSNRLLRLLARLYYRNAKHVREKKEKIKKLYGNMNVDIWMHMAEPFQSGGCLLHL